MILPKSLKILHLEDNEADAELIRFELQEYFNNCEVIHVIDVESYEKALSSDHFDVILSDYNIPGLHGLDSLFTAQKTTKNPIIYVSGAIGEESAVEMLKAGATDYVLKNKLEKLPLAIERAIREQRAEELIHQRERELEASNSFKASVINAIKNHIIVINSEGHVEETNAAWGTFAASYKNHFEHINFEDWNYFDLLKSIIPSEEEYDWICQKIREIITGKSQEFSYDFVFLFDNQRIWFTLSASQRLDQKGSVITHGDVTERVLSERKHQKNEQEFRSLSENAPNYIIKLNRDFQIEYINRDVMNVPKKDIIGKYANEIDTQKHFDFLHEELLKVFDTGKASFYNAKRTINGRDFHMGINIGPVVNASGYVENVILIIRDTTEEVESQEQISSQNRELLRIDEVNRIGLNQELHISDLISEALQLFPDILPANNRQFYFFDPTANGFVPYSDELDIRWIDSLKKKQKRNKSKLNPELTLNPHLKNAIECKKIVASSDPKIIEQISKEYNFETPDDSADYLTQKGLNIKSVAILPLHIEDSIFGFFLITSSQILSDVVVAQLERFISGVKSILLKKHAEKELIENEKRYRELFENIHEGFVIISAEGDIEIANPKFSEMTGYSNQELQKFDIVNLLKISPKVLTAPHAQEFEIELQRKLGERFWALVTTSPKMNSNNEVIGIMAVIRNITDEKLVDAWNSITANIARKISAEDTSVKAVFQLTHMELGRFMPSLNFMAALKTEVESTEVIYLENEFNQNPNSENHKIADIGLTSYVIDSAEPLWLRGEILQKFESDHKIEAKGFRPKSYIAAPLYIDNKVIGSIACASYDSVNAYTDFHFQILKYVGKHIGLFIDKIEANEDKSRILNLSQDLICIVNSDGVLRYSNPAFEKQLGYSQEELIESELSEFAPAEDSNIAKILKGKLDSDESNFTFESRLLAKTGAIKTIAWTAIAQEKDNLFYCIGRDVTEQLEIQKKIEESERRYRGLFERLHEGIMHSDPQGVILSINPGFCEIMGYKAEELIGKVGYEILLDDVTSRRLEQKIKYRRRGIPGFYEAKFRRKSGEFIWAQVSSTPDYNEKGEFVGIMSIVMDINERKKAEAEAFAMKEIFTKELEDKVTERTLELENAQKELGISLEKEKELSRLKSRFVSTASHQFRTPLSVIQSNIGILSMQIGAIEGGMDPIDFRQKFDKVYKRIKEQISKMTDLMDDVLILGKINTGNLDVRIHDYNLVEVCENVISGFSDILEGRTIEIALNGNVHNVSFDKQLFEHSFSNILSNAIKYSPIEDTPEVKIDFQEMETVISVKDFGIGIPADELVHLFEPFYRASNAKDYSGTGLGTSIAKEYLELMGAKIEVLSTLGEGTEFIIYLKN